MTTTTTSTIWIFHVRVSLCFKMLLHTNGRRDICFYTSFNALWFDLHAYRNRKSKPALTKQIIWWCYYHIKMIMKLYDLNNNHKKNTHKPHTISHALNCISWCVTFAYIRNRKPKTVMQLPVFTENDIHTLCLLYYIHIISVWIVRFVGWTFARFSTWYSVSKSGMSSHKMNECGMETVNIFE